MKMNKLRASSMHKCKKCLVDYLLNGQDSSSSPAALMGTILHEGFISHYEKILGKRIVYREKDLEDELLTGHIDGYIKVDKSIFELKTVNGWVFQKIEEARNEHIQQANIYMHLMQVDKTHIVYLNRDTGEYKAYDINYDHIILTSLYHKAEEAYKLAEKKTNPEDIELSEFETCDNYCKFKTKEYYKTPEGVITLNRLDKQLQNKLVQLVQEQQEASAQEKDAKASKAFISQRVLEILSENNIKKIIDLGVSFVETTRNSFDSKNFKADHLDLFEKYSKQTKSQSVRFPKAI